MLGLDGCLVAFVQWDALRLVEPDAGAPIVQWGIVDVYLGRGAALTAGAEAGVVGRVARAAGLECVVSLELATSGTTTVPTVVPLPLPRPSAVATA